MAKTPAIKSEDYADPMQVQKRMVKTPEPVSVIQDFVFQEDDPLDEKEKKLSQACKLRDHAEFFIMQAIGYIYLEGEWLITYKVNEQGQRISIPGKFNNDFEYIDHLTKITDYSRKQIHQLINAYRIYIKNEKFLNSINYQNVGSVRKILMLEKAMELVERGVLTTAKLKKLLVEESGNELMRIITEQKALPESDSDLDISPSANVKVRGDTLFIDDAPVLKFMAENASLKESLLDFFKAEKKKSELGEAFKESVDFYSKKITTLVSQEKIPVVIPIDSDVSDPKAFEKAAAKELDRFYKKWKIEH